SLQTAVKAERMKLAPAVPERRPMTEGKADPRPEKWQFSLATLLGLITAVAVVVGVVVQLKEYAIPFAPLLIGIGMVAVGWFFRRTRLMEWGCATSVIGLFFVCLCPVVPLSHEPSRRTLCNNNLKQIGFGMHNYHDVHKSFPLRRSTLADGTPGLSWRVSLLPFFESSSLYKQFRLDEAWNSLHNIPLSSQRPELYACPSAKRRLKSESDYYAIGGPDSCLPDGNAVKLDEVLDGTSNTVMVVESHTFNAVWSEPRDLDPATMSWTINQPSAPSSGHSGGAVVMFADASTRFLTEDTDPEVLKQLANRRDGLRAKDWDD
ncbi:MAG TPA: DUF1559 domain-containing protein, partial [Planctomycetaceae bacterium]|nr:DUF1559 domain-containing protein [Planctomycetaceae bacterium]